VGFVSVEFHNCEPHAQLRFESRQTALVTSPLKSLCILVFRTFSFVYSVFLRFKLRQSLRRLPSRTRAESLPCGESILLSRISIKSMNIPQLISSEAYKNAIPAHTLLLQDALREAATKTADAQAPETIVRRSLSACTVACANSPFWTLLICSLVALVIILVTRPPFVMIFERNVKQPWRSTLMISWFSTCVSVLVVVGFAAILPFIVQSARS